MLLSILICSLENRKESLLNLLKLLEPQINDDVEILVNVDSGELTTGEKRNKLLEKSKGDYIVFIDDDDLVSKDYIEKILNALKSKPDCCSLEGEITFKKINITKKFIHSLEYNSWFEKDNIYYRNPNHLNVVKRELALKVKFPHKKVGEDFEYSKNLLPFLKTEIKIKGVIYYYLTN